MKWSERSTFYKAVWLTQLLCALVYGIAIVCSLCDILPSVYELSWAQACFGTFFLCNGIDNLKISRTNAVLDFFAAAFAYLTAIVRWIL